MSVVRVVAVAVHLGCYVSFGWGDPNHGFGEKAISEGKTVAALFLVALEDGADFEAPVRPRLP